MATHAEHFLAALDLTTVSEVEPLARILDLSIPAKGDGFAGDEFKGELWDALSYYGSHDLVYALRGFRGVGYPEIVADVCKKKKVQGGPITGATVEAVRTNEVRLIHKYFEDIWDHMTEEEKVELLRSMNLDEGHARLGGAAAVLGVIAGEMGGFATYRLAATVAGFFVRALLGTSLRFGAIQVAMRGLGVILGPVGWIASGAWLAMEVMSPAYRKTVPAVLIVAALRQLSEQREVVGVMGSGSVGKDSLLKYVFGIDTEDIHPIPGATRGTKIYPVAAPSLARVLNFPGFGDLQAEVESDIRDQIRNCNLAIYVIDNSSVVRREEIERFRIADVGGRDRIVVFNKCDKLDEDEFETITNENRRRLGIDEPVLASLKPRRKGDNSYFETGVREIRRRINWWAEHQRKKPPMFPEES